MTNNTNPWSDVAASLQKFGAASTIWQRDAAFHHKAMILHRLVGIPLLATFVCLVLSYFSGDPWRWMIFAYLAIIVSLWATFLIGRWEKKHKRAWCPQAGEWRREQAAKALRKHEGKR